MILSTHSLPFACVAGGLFATGLTVMTHDAMAALAVATGALFTTWLAAMFAAQYLPQSDHEHHRVHPWSGGVLRRD
jgi:hypothetical protein